MLKKFKITIKELLKSARGWTLGLLQKLPISSEHWGSPKGYYLSTWDWIEQSGLVPNMSTIHYEVIDSYKSIDRSLPNPSEPTIHWQFPVKSHYEFPPTFVAAIPGARVYGSHGWVISPDDKLLADVSLALGAFNPEKILRHPIFQRLKLPAVVNFNQTIAVLSAGGGGNIYFHWMTDVLPRIHLLRQSHLSLDTIDHYLVNSTRLPFQTETLAILGIPNAKVITSDRYPHIKANQLVIPSLPTIPAQVPHWVCDFLRQSFLKDEIKSKTDTPKRIYISRSKASHRRVLNEPEVINCLKQRGFQCLATELLSIPEQAAVFANAEAIVAPHGGGLTNIIFCSPTTKVIEFFSPNCILPTYWALRDHIGFDYYYFLGKGERPNLPEDLDSYLTRSDFIQDLQKDIVVDIDTLINTMEIAGIR